MEVLVAQVAQKIGVPADRARTAGAPVLTFLKGKLPPALAGQLDQVLAGNSATSLGDLAGGLLGMKS
jgi:hypothetical protein